MEKINYKSLYKLQDRVLSLIFGVDSEFYLTGGTCLSRFYFEKRFSDDLDFFTNFSNNFHYSIREITQIFEKEGLFYVINTNTKDFVRIHIKENNQNLQLDFVNDRVKKFGEIACKNGVYIDNLQNILSNKLTAILSRDNPKDIFDIVLICLNLDFNWKKILLETKAKMVFQKEDLIFRLKSFPRELLKSIRLVDSEFLDGFNEKLEILMIEIENEISNSLN